MELVDWKKILLGSAGFGVGLALTLVVLLGGSYWWAERPKPWTSAAITSGAPEFSMTTGDELTFRVRYPLTNRTKHDYIFPTASRGTLMFKRSDDGSLVKVEDATWDENLDTLWPEDERNLCDKVKLSDYNTSLEKLTQTPKDSDGIGPDLVKFLDKRMQEIAGFVFFDYRDNYKIDLPRNWVLKASKY